LIVGDLTPREVLGRLRDGGLSWRVGPYSIRALTDLRDVARGMAFLYSAFPLEPVDAIVDAELRIRAKPLLPHRASIAVDGEVQYDWLPRRLVVPMAEWSLNVCVFHRSHQYFMLHAGVVEREGHALLLVGRAGSGKSTLSAALAHRGWRLLSDEVALIRPADLRIQPAPRPVSLKEQSIEIIRKWAPEAEIGPTWAGTSKGDVAHMLPGAACVARAQETAQARWIVFPAFDGSAGERLSPLSRAHGFLRAADNSFNYSVLGRRAFDTLTRVVDGCECFELSFSTLEGAVRRIDDLTRSVR